jgi:3-isopropylmalate/(R)-2-methylmalate dehydratase small subunit
MMILRGRVWKFGDDINTDLIFPRDALHLSPEDQVKLVFRPNRPGWAEMVEKGDIVVAGRNFGTGSSRPAAVLLKRLGIAGLAAESINGLFFRSCVSYGFPALECQGVNEAFQEGDVAVIDLLEGTVVNERTTEVLNGSRLTAAMADTLLAGGIEELLRRQGFMKEGPSSPAERR